MRITKHQHARLVLEEAGQGIVDRLIGNVCQEIGTTCLPLKPDESIDETA